MSVFVDKNEPHYQEMNLRTYWPKEDSDQTEHSRSLIRIFPGRILDCQGCKLSSCGQRRLESDSADAYSDLSLRWVHVSGVRRYVFSRCESELNGNKRNAVGRDVIIWKAKTHLADVINFNTVLKL